MTGELVKVSATFTTSHRAINELHELLDRFFEQASFVPTRARMLFTLAVAEIAGNIVSYVTTEPRNWSIHLHAFEDRIEATLSHGGPLVENAMAQPVMPDETAESGRGLALADRASAVSYSYQINPDTSLWHVVQTLRA